MSEKEKMSIPDEDIPGWIRILMESGFTQGELDKMLSGLNEKYEAQRYPDWNKSIEEQVKKVIKRAHELGVELSDENISNIRRSIKDHFREHLTGR